MSTAIIRCAVPWCRTTVDPDWDAHTCRHGVITCQGCDEADACEDCARAVEDVCPGCDGDGEVWDGHTREHDTGQPITYECRRCDGTGERTLA